MNFNEMLKRIEGMNEDNVFDRVLEFFRTIANLDKNDTIAAYRALSFMATSQDTLSCKNAALVEEVRRAIVGRMITIFHETPAVRQPEVMHIFLAMIGADYGNVFVKVSPLDSYGASEPGSIRPMHNHTV